MKNDRIQNKIKENVRQNIEIKDDKMDKNDEVLRVYDVKHYRKFWSFFKCVFFGYLICYTAYLGYTGVFPQNLKWADNFIILSIVSLCCILLFLMSLAELFLKNLIITQNTIVIKYYFLKLTIYDKNTRITYVKLVFLFSPTGIGIHDNSRSFLLRFLMSFSVSVFKDFDKNEFMDIIENKKGLKIIYPVDKNLRGDE